MNWFERFAKNNPKKLELKHDDEVYITRWWLIPRNRFFNIYLHRFSHSDLPIFHDHPWTSVSYILKGEIVEQLPGRGRICEQGRFFFRRATDLHYLEMRSDEPVWTLFITLWRQREWGFYHKEKWTHHCEFFEGLKTAVKEYE